MRIWNGKKRSIFWVLVLFTGACAFQRNDHAAGLKLLEAGRLPEAWQAFEKGYERDPESAYSLNNMGYVLEMRDGDLVGAAAYYRRAIGVCKTQPQNPEMVRLRKTASENLARVTWKLQSSPPRYI